MPRKLPSLPHVKFVRSKGKVYAYFNTGQKVRGKIVYAPMPPPSAPDFFDKYTALKAGRTKRAAKEYTVARLIDDFLKSREYRGKANATQRLYAIQLEKARPLLGKFPVDGLRPDLVRLVLDGEDWNAGTQNAFVAALGACYAWGRERGKAMAEPTRGIRKVEGGEHDPWPEDILDAALSSDDDRVRLAVHLLYYTGQRIGDVCKMRWGDIHGDLIRVRQQKTGKMMEIRLHSDLRAELDRTPRKAITILTSKTGRPPRVERLRLELKAFAAKHGVDCVPHGLRKNAVNALLEEGCTIAEVAAVTGQTHGMVEHYAARVDKRRLGASAILKFEQRKRRNGRG